TDRPHGRPGLRPRRRRAHRTRAVRRPSPVGGTRARPGAALTGVARVSVAGLVARLDRLQQRHRVLGFPYAVVRKYVDDGGGREAALITYYGFLSIFPVLLLGV